jgi:hypothetical protein
MLTGRYPVKFYLRTGNVRAVRQGSTAKPKDRQTPDENSSHEDSLLPTFRPQDKIKLIIVMSHPPGAIKLRRCSRRRRQNIPQEGRLS